MILVESVVSNIQSSMKAGHTTAINTILHDANVHNHMKVLRIIDTEGMIINSADLNDVGREISEEEREKILHTKQNHFYFTSRENSLDSYARIVNTPDCQGCHDAKKPFIATIEAGISLDDFNNFINFEKKKYFFDSALTILLIIGAFLAIMTFYVERPIRSLNANLKQIEQGNFEARNSFQNSNEINNNIKSVDVTVSEITAEQNIKA